MNKKTIKQYVVSPAYAGNDRITVYINGEVVGSQIASYYELDGAMSSLESFGYERAYDVAFYERKVHEAEEELADATELYKQALKQPLYVKE